MSGNVFLVHDDPGVRGHVRAALERGGFEVSEGPSLEAVLGRLETSGAALVLIPWPGEAELRGALAKLKKPNANDRRVVVLARQSELSVAINALTYGADDCVGVPFVAEELVTRVAVVMERAPAAVALERLQAGPVLLDKGTHVLTVSGEHVELAPTEFRLFAFFLENQGRVFSRGELLKGAWAKHVEAGPRTVDVHVRRLRQTLEPFGCDDMIQTVRGFGYRFAAGNWAARTVAPRGIAKLAR